MLTLKNKKKLKLKPTKKDILKANRRGMREAELEQNINGWKAVNRPFVNKKIYNRKKLK